MKLHRFDAISFIAGLAITLVGLLFLIPAEPGDLIEVFTDFGGWFWPAVFLAIGLAVLAPIVAMVRRRDEDA